jgi:putative endonuclease
MPAIARASFFPPGDGEGGRAERGRVGCPSHHVIPAKAGSQYDGRMKRQPCVYILASRKHGTLYTGVTSNIAHRVALHKSMEIEGFTRRYGVKRLVYVEPHGTMNAAIRREKQIKEWKRAWKVQLIEADNPEWDDLYARLLA